MYCRNCGQQLNDNQAICLSCGVPVGKGHNHCYNCGKAVDPNAVFCVGCGVALTPATAEQAPSNSEAKNTDYLAGNDKMIMALICFFLGGLGVHNFVMGETKKGIGKIIMSFLCGIGGILALIDFIKILRGTYVINTEKMF